MIFTIYNRFPYYTVYKNIPTENTPLITADNNQ